ncbi:amidohydrolase family protein [Archaeoglobus veneficus]|uniref:5-methylthioadenosine/S-adenosylhomocysteine deaminase n=1 Tax=Archaeoglobus veneficus (strain DSM 11195 / SNP6) TaxID=693661 RepID=F2KTB3_ARCVS|nr:amidohydrolase family protein [Archaeoglobus veneficus]AEA47143.1 5-methylthioadenosine/S-adenosylhomocysteine deaminase [Archaeoglobus veneficus SNP6]
MYDLCISNGLCFINNEFIEANIGIEGNRIAYVGKEDVKGEFEIDAGGKLVMPGLFNAHTHLAMTLLRGYVEDMPLMDWLSRVWQVEAKLSEEDVYWGSMLGILEMIKSGTTAFADMYFHMDEVAKAVGETGIRAVLSYGMIESGDDEKGEKELKIGTEFVKDWDGAFNGRIKAIFGPHAPYTCSPEFLLKVKERAEELDTLIHIHVAETRQEFEDIKKRYGKTPVRLLDDIGFLSKRVIVAHGVWVEDDEISILKERGVSVVHNPASNLKLAAGIARVTDMLNAGVNVCLGTDGAASNNTYNLFEEIKLASLLQKVATGRADALKASDVLTMATRNGYRAYGLNGGKIEEGMLADIIMLDAKRCNYVPSYNPLYSVVYASYGCEVTHVIVDGELILEDGMVLTMDEEKVIDKAEKLKDKFLVA